MSIDEKTVRSIFAGSSMATETPSSHTPITIDAKGGYVALEISRPALMWATSPPNVQTR